MSEQSVGESILRKLKVLKPGAQTTFRDGQIPLSQDAQSTQGDGQGSHQPGENTTELHPGDQEAMDAHRAPQLSQSNNAADAANAGIPFGRTEPPGGYDISGQAGDTTQQEATPTPTTPIKPTS